MSLLVIILCTSLGNLNFKSNGPSYFDKLFLFLKFRLHLFESTRTCTKTTNNCFSYRTNSTWWNLKSTKSYYGCIRKFSGYIIHSTEGNYFWRGKGTQQTFVLMKTSWRRLKDVFRFRLQKTSSRRLHEDEYILINHTSSEDVFKMFWSRPIHSPCPYVFKTSSKRLQDVSQIRLEDIFKTFWRRIIKLNCFC